MLPVGEANKKIVDHARKSLAEAFPDFSCVISKKILQVPRGAYNPTRHQYHSSIILLSISKYATINQVDRVFRDNRL